MTGTNDKVRSIFLTVLMVVSVFAGTVAMAGTAAAGNTDDLSVEPTTAGTAGASYTHDIDYGGADGTSIQNFDVDFGASNPDLGSVTESDISVYHEGTEYQDGYSSLTTSGSSLEFTLSNSIDGVDNGDNVTVVIGDVVNGDQGTGYTFTTGISDTNDENEDETTGTYEITSSGDGTDTGDQDPPYEPIEDFDATYETGANRWTGQTLLVDIEEGEDGDDDGVVELHEVEDDTDAVGQLVTEVSYDQDTGEALIGTSGLQGEYVLTDGNGNVLKVSQNGNATQSGDSSMTDVDSSDVLTVVNQDFSASFDDNTVVQGESVDVSFESNRGGGYFVTVSSDGLSTTELEETFGDAQEDRDGVQVLVSGNDVTQSYDLESDVSTGNFTVDFEVADTGDSDSDFLDIGSSDRQASFSQAVYSEERGDVAEFTVELEQSSTADVQVGGPDVNYNVTLTVTDNDDDGEVTVQWDTWNAGRFSDEGNAFSAAGDEDSVSQVRRFSNDIPDDERVSAADYDLAVFVQGTEEDVGVIDLGPRSTDSAQQWVATGSATTYENSTELLDAVTQGSETANGDLAVTQVQASGIFAYVTGAADLEDPSDDGVSVTIEQSGETINQEPKEVSLDQSGVNLYFDADNNQHFVVVDTDVATADRGTQSGLDLENGETYNVTFTIDGDVSPYVDDGETEEVTSQFTVTEPTAEFDTAADGNVTVESAAEQQITGTTNIAPGSSITVRARATGDSPFLKSNTTEVAEDGTFTATFDFSNVSEDTQFTVTIPSPNRFEDDAQTPGIVAPAPQADVSISDQTSDGTTVTVDSVSLSDGGFVTIHDSTLLDGATFDSVRGTSAYLEAGDHSDITVELDEPYEEDGTVIAMPHLDTNGNEEYDFVTSDGAEDGPYTDEDGNITLDDAALTVETTTPSPTPTASPTPTETDEPTPTETDEPTPTPSPTPGDGPGFGLVAALIALAGAALIALRRD